MDDTPETWRLFEQGRVQQRCSRCGREEAAGAYCTACRKPSGPADWHRPEPTEKQKAHLARIRALRTNSPEIAQTPE